MSIAQKNKSSNHYNKKNYNQNHNYNQNKKNDYNRDDRDNIKKEVAREINHKHSTSEKVESYKKKKHPIINLFLFLTLVSSLAYFGITLWIGSNDVNFFSALISSVLLVIFSILFMISFFVLLVELYIFCQFSKLSSVLISDSIPLYPESICIIANFSRGFCIVA